ncbi:SusC/RagA family TonB-linked outer membrane protein [Saprospiraceae bacterium]|nr:SusC/RagA family TonB-linked outer membrane protein [Saprospiraceae bacterium]
MTKYNLLRTIQLSFVLFCIPLITMAQSAITGSVKDAVDGTPLLGATVVIKDNSTIGTITDIDGNFSLQLPDGATTLIISYTGYKTLEESINNRSEINVVLASGEVLDDIVVVGYGTVKREDATGAIASVGAEDFNKGSITSAQELLAGKIAGVSITTDPGPGGGASILIRGLSSLSATNDPLIIIDNVPIDGGGASGSRNPLNLINPNDIETFTVLKDASATAIYGSRASGGVILITTKTGNAKKKLSLSYNANVASSSITKKVDVLTAEEFTNQINNRYIEGDEALALLGTDETDWQDEIYRSALSTDHNLAASGGAFGIPYRVSLGYTNKNGVLKTDNFNRFTTAISLTPGFLDNTLQIKANFKNSINRNHFADRGAIGNAISYDPSKSVLDETSPYGGYTTWTAGTMGFPNMLAPVNPIALLNQKEDNSRVVRSISSLNVDYRLPFLKALRVNLNIANDQASSAGTVIIPTDAAFAFNASAGGGTNNSYDSKSSNNLLETYLNYKENYGKSVFDVMGGYSWQHFYWESGFNSSDAAGTPEQTTADTNKEELYLISLFGRAQYSYNDRLFANFTLRRDGASRFSPENRWGLFPAASVALKLIDNEKNMFNYLKFRLGWGVTGQQDIGRGNRLYAYQGIYQTGFETAQYQFGDRYITTIRPNGYDEEIKWEETATINIGTDFNLIKNKLDGSIDVYRRLTKDLLNNVTVPGGSNLTNEIVTNIGNMESRGLELALNYTAIDNGKLKWDISANMAYNNSTITKLNTSEDSTYVGILTGGIAGGVGSNIQVHSVGYTPNSFYVFEQKYDEAGNILEGEFVDRNNDGIVNIDDKYRYSDPYADYIFGFTSNLSYRNFDFSFAGRANVGNKIYNNVQTNIGALEGLYNPSGAIINIHQSAIDNNAEQQANLTFSDYFVRDASFLRFDHFTLGYDFTRLVKKSSRLYVTVQNPLVITNYDGLDPETSNGIDSNLYPRARTVLLGLSIQL